MLKTMMAIDQHLAWLTWGGSSGSGLHMAMRGARSRQVCRCESSDRKFRMEKSYVIDDIDCQLFSASQARIDTFRALPVH